MTEERGNDGKRDERMTEERRENDNFWYSGL